MHRNTGEEQLAAILCIIAFVALVRYARRGWKPAGTAFGTATWASDKLLAMAGMLGGNGLILGRTFSGALIRLPAFCHGFVCGGTGSGKGVSVILTNLLTYLRGSILCFDVKGDLFSTAGPRRAARGERIVRLAPFDGGKDALNPLDSIPRHSPMLVDSANALAEALVVREGHEADPHWNSKAVQVIRALIVLVLIEFKEGMRNLNSVQEIASDPDLLRAASYKLRELGGIPARLGSQLKTLFEKETGQLTKEGAGVGSTVSRHLAFLDSELVAKAVATSTFDPAEMRKPGITVFMQIGPDQLDAQRGLLRCWTSTFIRVIGAVGNEQEGEVLCLIDEAAALGPSLPALEEALVRGRSAGLRLFLAYQSPSQITAAFKDKQTLIYDNCSTHIYLGAATSIEGAERISKSIGDRTQVVESYGDNQSQSWQQGGVSQQGGQTSRGSSRNYSQSGRALLRPEEILTLNNDYLIAFLRGMSPILARRVKWYEDPAFNPAVPKPQKQFPFWWLLMVGAVGLIVWALIGS